MTNYTRRADLYRYIIRYKQDNGGATPRVRDMMAALGISSTSVVHYHLQRMAREGRITLENDGKYHKYHYIGIPGERWLAPEEEY